MTKLNSKSGITLSALIVYLVLFTAFTITTLSVSSNLNKNVFDSRADIENNKNVDKTIIYFLESSKNSTSVAKIDNKITFSNNDEYDFKDNAIYLNGRKIIKNVHKLITNISENTVYLDITYERYGKILNKELKFNVKGDGL